MSSEISVSSVLAEYAAGRISAEQLAAVVAREYYRETRNGKRETLRPIVDVIERVHPGVVELKATEQGPGFDIRLAQRPFPKRYETDLRGAVEQVLRAFLVSRVPFPEEAVKKPGLLQRIVAAIRKVFSA